MRALMSAKLKWTGSAATAVILIATFAWMMAGCAGITRLPNSTTVSALSISTTSLPSGTVGQAYSATLAASGGNAPYTWSVSSGSLPSGVNLTAAGAVTGMPSSAGTFAFTATASDAKNATAAKSLSILVGAASQPLSITTSSLPAGTVGQTYTATLTASGGNAPYTWSVSGGGLPPGLSLASASGAITGTPNSAGTFAFTATATDSKGATAAGSLHILVATTGQPLSITTTNLPSGTSGTAYTATVQASGGKTPYGWSIASGALPAGINLNASSGAISGTPTQSGSFSVTIRAQDSSSPVQTTSKIFAVAIAAAVIPLSISTSTLPSVGVNQAYSANLQAAGGTPPYTWSLNSGQLPAGIALASNGQISGTPTTSGQSNFGVTAKDSSSTPETANKGLAITVSAAGLDQYGGRTDIKCANATGWFHVEEINSHWWFCTPLGNAFYSLGVTYSPGYIHGKFAAADVNRRLESWGFDTVQVGAHSYQLPTTTDCSTFQPDSNGVCANPVKMPFIVSVNAAYYSMVNIANAGSAPFLANPVKNMLAVRSPFYTDYVSEGVADYYDSGIGTWLQDDIQNDVYTAWPGMKSSMYANYVIGVASDDSDYMLGLVSGPDFATIPAGQNSPNLAMVVATLSPIETANTNVADRSGSNFVYADTLVHSKLALRNMLATEYGTISALNTAWGSNYTTFDSSGTCVGTQPIACASSASADAVGSGNGSALNFSTTLSHTTISKNSLQILVGGVPVAGDLGNGTLYGPNLSSGTINYSTGALSLTFASGKAPASGAAIIATYVANGWGTGTGFLDEDDRPSHQSWMGTDWTAMSNADATTKADMNSFLGQIAAQYFSTMRTQIKAAFPNVMYLGPNTLATWCGVPAAPVLKAAGQYIDAFIAGGGTCVYTQPEMDYIEQNYGNKPYFNAWYSSANADSAVGGVYSGAVGDYPTQVARGQAYYNTMTAMLKAAHTTAGDYPYVGVYWWEYTDQPSQSYADGLVTPSDNAYDGREPSATAVPCSPPISTNTCGSEPAPGGAAVRPFGNLIGGSTGVAAANGLWLSVP